jgi:hypothetical protein
MDSRGRLWVGDVGSDDFEEVNVVVQGGENFGWSVHEGPCEGACDELTDPVVVYDHEDSHRYVRDDESARNTNLRVVWVGPEYRADSVDRYDGRLTDKVLFGDLCVGFVRTAALDDEGGLVSDEPLLHKPGTVAWKQGSDGFLYTITVPTCQTEDPVEPDVRFYRLDFNP